LRPFEKGRRWTPSRPPPPALSCGHGLIGQVWSALTCQNSSWSRLSPSNLMLVFPTSGEHHDSHIRRQFPATISCAGASRLVEVPRQIAANTFARSFGDAALLKERSRVTNMKHLGQQAGFVQEHWHVQSYNKNAIAQGSSFRAEMSKPGAPADALIVDARLQRAVVDEVQFKRYTTARQTQKAFASSKYDGMQKVGPRDHAGEGVSACIDFGGVQSDPIARQELDDLTSCGGRLRRFDVGSKILAESLQAAALGAAGGFLISLLYTGGELFEGRAKRRQCARALCVGAICGGVSSACWKLAQIALECAKVGAGRFAPLVGSLVGARMCLVSAAEARRRQDFAEVGASAIEFCAGVGATVWLVSSDTDSRIGWAWLGVGILGAWVPRALKRRDPVRLEVERP